MSRTKTPLTVERLRDVLAYDEGTGVFTWRRKPSKFASVMPGDVAGTPNGNGYLRIFIGGSLYHAHRLAWLYVHGQWPQYHVDHVDGRKDHNAIRNLRDVDRAVNLQNRRGAQSNNASGLLGAHAKRGKFSSSIQTGKQRTHLGTFATAEEASAAHSAARSAAA